MILLSRNNFTMIKCGRTLLLFLLCFGLLISKTNGQNNGCGLEIIRTDFVINSVYEIQIDLLIQSNNVEAEGIAYLIDNKDLQSLGLDIFWTPAAFSVHSNETFQIAISGTSTSIISIPDELELSGRVAFSFNEEPVILNDINIEIKEYEGDSIVVEIDTLSISDDIAILDSTTILIDSIINPIDTFLTLLDTVFIGIDTIGQLLDTLIIEPDTLNIIDNASVEHEDSLLLTYTTFSSDSILIGNELILSDDFPDLCKMTYVCELIPVNGEQAETNEYRISNDDSMEIRKKGLETISGLIFDNPTFKMEEFAVNVFPNPSIDYFYVSANELNENSKMIMYDTNGNVVIQREINNNTDYQKVNTKNLPKGLYLILIKSNKQASRLTKLIIK